MQLKTARLLFQSAAIYNWAAVLLFLPELAIAARLGIDPAPTGTILEHVALLAVFLFGLGYWIVARSPGENRAVVTLGLLGKLGVVAIVGAHFLAGSAGLAWPLIVAGDAIYAALFTYYLRTTE